MTARAYLRARDLASPVKAVAKDAIPALRLSANAY